MEEKDRFVSIASQSPLHQNTSSSTSVSSETFSTVLQEIGSQRETYESIEHKAIGDRAFRELCQISRDNRDVALLSVLNALQQERLFDAMVWYISNGLKLSSGDIIALAGDYFGLPLEPISRGENDALCKDRFLRAYDTLCTQQGHQREIKKLLKQFTKAKEKIGQGLKQGRSPFVKLHSIGIKQKIVCANITRYSFLPGTFFHSRALDLAKQNFDHFGGDAKTAYRAGHAIALETAYRAFQEVHPAERLKILVVAITQELFACHFLTDLFASGHIRTIRKEIYDYVQATKMTPGKSLIAGLLSKEMHDEDNRNGLLVKNLKGAKWKSFGDECYFEETDSQNRDQVTEAVVAAIKSIFDTFLGREISFHFEDYIPILRKINPTQPLFKCEDHTVKVRKNLKDIFSTEYESHWDPVKILCQLKTNLFRSTEEQPNLDADAIASIERELNHLVDSNEISVELGDGENHTCTIF